MNSQLGLLAALLTVSAACVFAQPEHSEPVWLTEWPEAQRMALKANKPIFAVMACKH